MLANENLGGLSKTVANLLGVKQQIPQSSRLCTQTKRVLNLFFWPGNFVLENVGEIWHYMEMRISHKGIDT